MSNGTKTNFDRNAFARLMPSFRVSPGLTLSLLVLSVPLAHSGSAQDDGQADRHARGVICRYTNDRGMTVERVEETIGNWADRTPLGMNPDRPFQADWQGYVLARPEGQFRFQAYFRGKLTLSIDGQRVIDLRQDRPQWYESEPVELEYGWRKLEATFEAPADSSQLVVAWSGPGFATEPLTSEHLYHEAATEVDDRLDVGVRLIRDLRCGACHTFDQRDWIPRAPSLTHVTNNLDSNWMVRWLTDQQRAPHSSMPSFALSGEEATAIVKYLADGSLKTRGSSFKPGNAESGEELFLSVGCLACHQWKELGPEPARGTADLTHVADKRSRQFFDVYLREPARINADHRMPVFDLEADERHDLIAFLCSLSEHQGSKSKSTTAPTNSGITPTDSEIDGKRLVEKLRCIACHQIHPTEHTAVAKTALRTDSDWQNGCLTKPNREDGRPGYNLAPDEQAAIRHVVSICTSTDLVINNRRGREVLRANRCLACHPRGRSRGIEETAMSVANEHRHLAPVVPALIPPSLNRTGDKHHRDALRDAIRQVEKRRRPWLRVRMPRFRFEDDELRSLVDALVRSDQFPTQPKAGAELPDTPTLVHAGTRLVTAGGFGCTSCHAIGGVQPPEAPLSARAPDLAGLGQRVNRDWFDAWVKNPSRIVPRIEMPSITVAVPGVLDQNLDHQLQAVWHVLNKPGFRPPQPDPIRVVRRSGDRSAAERAVVMTDVLQVQNRLLVKPFLIALPNRHNIVFDLATGQLFSWSMGDAAYQRTRGKSWFWELAGTSILRSDDDRSDLAVMHHDRRRHAVSVGQFVASVDGWRHIEGGIQFFGSLDFNLGDRSRRMKITQRYVTADSQMHSGFRRELTVDDADPEDELRLRVIPPNVLRDVTWSEDRRQADFSSGAQVRIDSPDRAQFDHQGYVTGLQPGADGKLQVTLRYLTLVPVDRFPAQVTGPNPLEPSPVKVVPGFRSVRLPITDQVMPTGIDWRPDGRMLISSLKGRVWSVRDNDGDGIEETVQAFSDELAAPFGIAASRNHVDVINKFGLLRLFDEDHDDFAERVITLAAGWGHTDDYHDWAVGLPRGPDGSYYVALSCQQDDRSKAAAYLRGRVLRLTPRSTDTDQPLSYAVQEVSAGHRFPIGIALSRDSQLFVTDNQGNYNPYNELNHVQPGVHFGFVNKLESDHNAPPLTSPAVNIPHPWTRSVNGICFLDSPRTIERPMFGPFEGHLIGCEYDTRRLIRMTLQTVGDTVQGAAYPFSLDHGEDPHTHGFLGPLTAALSPRGEIYVGDIRDSGWGGGPNHGAIVRLTPDLKTIPPGIAEVTALHDGFEIRFTQPVDPHRAADRSNYSVSSATRVATPAYGGPDKNRSTDSIVDLQVSPDARQVRIVLDELKTGYVYDFHLKNLTDEPLFHPAMAFYTMRVVPEKDVISKSDARNSN